MSGRTAEKLSAVVQKADGSDSAPQSGRIESRLLAG
jgi:hypothetical protein